MLPNNAPNPTPAPAIPPPQPAPAPPIAPPAPPQNPPTPPPAPTPVVAPEQQIQPPSTAPILTKMNDLMILYAISAYSYFYAYRKTVNDIQESADGHGLFNSTSTNLIGILDTNAAAGEISTIKTIDDEDKENEQSAKRIVAEMEDGPEKQKLEQQLSQLFVPIGSPEE
jgi:hypothetical protein